MKRCILRLSALLLATILLFASITPCCASSLASYTYDSFNSYGLPDYWLTYLAKKQSAIDRADINLGFYGVSFAFITDVHVNANAMRSPDILSYLNEHTGIHKVVCGGDLIYAYTSREKALEQLILWRNATSSLKVVNLLGNHDLNSNAQPDENAYLPLSTFYALECRPSESYVSWEKGCVYGYEDDPFQKVRYIYLDTKAPPQGSIDQKQIDWMKEKILTLGKGWTVVVFPHRLFKEAESTQTKLTFGKSGKIIKKALDEIYDQSKAVIACVITGHIHRDYTLYSDKGYPMIATTCDAYKQAKKWDPVQHTLDTTSEQCIDLFYINTKKRTIQTIRIGVGDQAADRSFTY